MESNAGSHFVTGPFEDALPIELSGCHSSQLCDRLLEGKLSDCCQTLW